jgi:hypothetical protein
VNILSAIVASISRGITRRQIALLVAAYGDESSIPAAKATPHNLSVSLSAARVAARMGW